MPVDYNSTINLPKTDFPMRASLPQREPDIIKKWQKEDLYNKILDNNKGKPSFILHDGPPYANGDIHLGHALNKILKDFIIKYKNMNGFYAPYVPGWDTHGLPIELQAIKKIGLKRDAVSEAEFREKCKEFALKYVKNQKEQFTRLGSIGDYENPYLTLKPEFEARQIEVFGEMAKKGYIYKGLKPVYWCPNDETALAEAEIEYIDDKCESIYVKFRVSDDKGLFKDYVDSLDNVYFVIWTTTTWTLPGNVAICVGPDFQYNLVKANNEIYVIARDLVDNVMKSANIDSYEVIAEFTGNELENMVALHPFIDRNSYIIVGDHVTLESGTGCVHTAPGHGAEDYVVCRNYPDLPILVPVDSKGVLNEQAGEFQGLKYSDANVAILEKLKETGALLTSETIIHPYPHCWRCKSPIIFRATEQCFCSINDFKDAAVECAKGVNWLPKWGEDRIVSMIKDRADWCISRQRIWGVPIPIFYCEECGEQHIDDETIKSVSDIFRKEGSVAWCNHTASELLPKGYKCKKCGSDKFKKETDIMDVWFDSGSSHFSVLENYDSLSWPADLYLEGNDQYRGWFQSSLLTSVAVTGKAPYSTVITHGMVVDGEGKKMSKSLGNGMMPSEVVSMYGADILRLWVASSDYQGDVRFSKDILKQLSEAYRKIRNTARFILGNLNGFDPNCDSVEFENLNEIDKWAIIKLKNLIKTVKDAYDNYEYHTVFHAIHNFCVVDMSNFYLDIIKDRLYIEKIDSAERKNAQYTMFTILNALTLMLAPIISFTADEIWGYLPRKSGEKDIVFLNDIPNAEDFKTDEAVFEKWNNIYDICDNVKKALELARSEKIIGSSLEAGVTIYSDKINADLEEDLKLALIVSSVKVKAFTDADNNAFVCPDETIKVVVSKASGEKCERCWSYSETVGKSSKHPTLCERCAKILGE